MLKKSIITLLFVILFIPLSVKAIELGFGKTSGIADVAGYGTATETTFAENVGVVIKVALSMVGVIFLGLMVYAGILWMTARGEEEHIEKAKKIIMACIIGLFIVAGAYSITALVVPRVLDKTTGVGGGKAEPPVGELLVTCCKVAMEDEDGYFDHYEFFPVDENACYEQEGGEYLGLKTVTECQTPTGN